MFAACLFVCLPGWLPGRRWLSPRASQLMSTNCDNNTDHKAAYVHLHLHVRNHHNYHLRWHDHHDDRARLVSITRPAHRLESCQAPPKCRPAPRASPRPGDGALLSVVANSRQLGARRQFALIWPASLAERERAKRPLGAETTTRTATAAATFPGPILTPNMAAQTSRSIRSGRARPTPPAATWTPIGCAQVATNWGPTTTTTTCA